MNRLSACLMFGLLGLVALPHEASSQQPPLAESGKDDPSPTANQLYEAARLQFFQGEFQAATVQLEAAARQDPRSIAIRLLLARAYRHADQTESAIRTLEQLLEIDPDQIEARLELAELINPEKQPQRVIALLQPLLRFEGEHTLFQLLARAHGQLGQQDQARKYYVRAIELDSRSAADYVALGAICLGQERYAQAVEAFEAAVSLGKESPVLRFQLATAYAGLQRFVGPVTVVQVAASRPGELAGSRILIADVPGRQETYYAAESSSALYQATLAGKGGIDTTELQLLLGRSWFSARQYDLADRIYQQLESRLGDEPPAAFWQQWAQVAQEQQDWKSYVARIRKAAEIEPESYTPLVGEALVEAAEASRRHGDLPQYVEFLEQAVAASPLSARLHLALGDAHWFLEQRPAAVRQYRMVLQLEPAIAQRRKLEGRISGDDPTVVFSGALVGNHSPTSPEAQVALEGIVCPVTGQPARAEFSLDHHGGKLFFHTAQAVKQFERAKAPHLAKANLQLFLTRQAVPVICPLTGRRLHATMKAQVAGVEMGVCCRGCQDRAEQANATEQLQLIFNDKNFARCFQISGSEAPR